MFSCPAFPNSIVESDPAMSVSFLIKAAALIGNNMANPLVWIFLHFKPIIQRCQRQR